MTNRQRVLLETIINDLPSIDEELTWSDLRPADRWEVSMLVTRLP